MFLRALAASAAVGTVTLLPVIILGLVKANKPLVSASIICFAIFVADIFAVFLPTAFGAQGMLWAWSGKIVEIGLALVLCRVIIRNWSFLNIPSQSWLPVTLLIALLTTIPTVLGDWNSLPNTLDMNVFTYQALMPGIAEELIYRLLLLYVIDQAFGRSVTFFGVNIGWGVVISTILFYGAHCVSFDANWALSIEYIKAIDFLIYGFALCWLRYKFDSILPCIIAHNVHNIFLVSLPSIIMLMK
jgi:hypothetical protein